MIETHKQQKLDVLSKHEIQNQILQGMIDQHEKDKTESEAKNKEVIIYKGCNVIIRKGDLTEEREDAIVNPANEQLDHAGGAAKAIASKGGKSYSERVKKIYQEIWKLTNWRSNYNKCWRSTMRKSNSCCWTNLP